MAEVLIANHKIYLMIVACLSMLIVLRCDDAIQGLALGVLSKIIRFFIGGFFAMVCVYHLFRVVIIWGNELANI